MGFVNFILGPLVLVSGLRNKSSNENKTRKFFLRLDSKIKDEYNLCN